MVSTEQKPLPRLGLIAQAVQNERVWEVLEMFGGRIEYVAIVKGF